MQQNKSLWLLVCVYMDKYTHTHTHIYIYIYIYIYILGKQLMPILIHTYILYAYIHTYIHTYLRKYIQVCTHMYYAPCFKLQPTDSCVSMVFRRLANLSSSGRSIFLMYSSIKTFIIQSLGAAVIAS